jgi:hypothetical protein
MEDNPFRFLAILAVYCTALVILTCVCIFVIEATSLYVAKSEREFAAIKAQMPAKKGCDG